MTRDSEDDDDPATISFAYTTANGKVTDVDITDFDGKHKVYHFSENGYLRSEVLDANGRRPISVTYDRSDATNVASATTVRCMRARTATSSTQNPPVPTVTRKSRDAVIRANCR